ncbi:hypothetical protein [Mucilaginibacter sp. HD30]
MAGAPDTQSKRWLIIFLIYADFTTPDNVKKIEKMKVGLNSLFGEIITTPIDSKQSRMFVALNSVRYFPETTNNHINDLTWLLSIENSGSQNKICDWTPIDNSTYLGGSAQGNHPLQQSERILRILKKTNVAEDEEVMLMTWDHGSSFGIFRQQEQTLKITDARDQFYANLPQFPFLKYFLDEVQLHDWAEKRASDHAFISLYIDGDLAGAPKSAENTAMLDFHLKNKTPFYYNKQTGKLSFQRQKNTEYPEGTMDGIDATPLVPEILKNQELDAALKAWIPNKRVGVLLMYNCWMMNLHTMYAFKDSVHCLVAPQGDIDLPGFSVKDILTYINPQDKPGKYSVDAVSLAKVCAETIDSAYSNAKAVILDPAEPDVINLFKIFAVDLTRRIGKKPILEIQLNRWDKLVQQLINEILNPTMPSNELKYFLKYIRSVCFDFSHGVTKSVDLVNWVRGIRSADAWFSGTKRMLVNPIITPIQDLLKVTKVNKNPLIIARSSGSRIYLSGNDSGDQATIPYEPTGYSIFFPLQDCSDDAKLKDNVTSDPLLNHYKNWQKLLTLLDPAIVNVFLR